LLGSASGKVVVSHTTTGLSRHQHAAAAAATAAGSGTAAAAAQYWVKVLKQGKLGGSMGAVLVPQRRCTGVRTAC
jgi:hypothetical protein